TDCAIANICSTGGVCEIDNGRVVMRLPADLLADVPGWWGIRQLTATADGHRLSLWLDDVDPYRSSYEPLLPQRLPPTEAAKWETLLDGAWRLMVRCLPDMANAFQAGFSSIVPRPMMPFPTV